MWLAKSTRQMQLKFSMPCLLLDIIAPLFVVCLVLTLYKWMRSKLHQGNHLYTLPNILSKIFDFLLIWNFFKSYLLFYICMDRAVLYPWVTLTFYFFPNYPCIYVYNILGNNAIVSTRPHIHCLDGKKVNKMFNKVIC